MRCRRAWAGLVAAGLLLGAVSGTARGAPPANDSLEFSAPLSLGFSLQTSTTEATHEPGEPNHAGATDTSPGSRGSVWFSITPTGQSITVDTCGSGFDTVLAVYSGPASPTFATLTPKASNDNDSSACPATTAAVSKVTFTASAGPAAYYVALDGHLGATGPAVIRAYVTGSPPPPSPPPDTTITSGPEGTITTTSARFEFTATAVGGRFQCSLDGAGFAECISPVIFSGLAAGPHLFKVRYVDAYGQPDSTPAERSFSVAAAGGPGESGADVTAPTLSRLRRRGASLRFNLSESATVTLTIQRRRGSGRYRRVARLKRAGVKGANSVRLPRKVRKRRGRYRAVLFAVDGAGNRSANATARFRIRRS